ncbi:MAG: cysteine desulfurase NifS [Nitrospirota bacterium]
MRKVYLDNAATTPTDPEVVRAMLPYFSEIYGNPSSAHSWGFEAREAVERARKSVAGFMGARSNEVVFTSGGTESDNAAIKGVAFANRNRGDHIITSSIEHHAVLEPCAFLEKNGFDITYLPVDRYGLVSPDDVKKVITKRTILISVMHANNEIGTIQPIAEIGKIAKENGIIFHTDAVQTFGHMRFDVNELGADLLSVSAHKLYGPKGVGALYIREGTKLSPFMHGGTQERGWRASTHNVPGIVGFGKAVEIASEGLYQEQKEVAVLRDRLMNGILERIPHSVLNGHPAMRMPGNVNVSFKNAEGELIMTYLDQEGIACSTGSACNAATKGPSHVLLAIGLPHHLITGSLRLTLGKHTTAENIDYVLGKLEEVVKRVRELSPFREC